MILGLTAAADVLARTPHNQEANTPMRIEPALVTVIGAVTLGIFGGFVAKQIQRRLNTHKETRPSLRVQDGLEPNPEVPAGTVAEDHPESTRAPGRSQPLSSHEIFEHSRKVFEGPFGLGRQHADELFRYLDELSRTRKEVHYQYETILLDVVTILTLLHEELGLDREILLRHPQEEMNELRWNIIRGALSFLEPNAMHVAFDGDANAAKPAAGEGQPLLAPLEALEEAIHSLAKNEDPRFKLPAFWDEETPAGMPAIFMGAIHFILKEKETQRKEMNDPIDAKRIGALHQLYERLSGRITPDNDVLAIREDIGALPAERVGDVQEHLERKPTFPREMPHDEVAEKREEAFRALASYLTSQAPRLRELILQEFQALVGWLPVTESFETLGDLIRRLTQVGISRLQANSVLSRFTRFNGAAHYPAQFNAPTLESLRALIASYSGQKNLDWNDNQRDLMARVVRTVYYELTGEARQFENAMVLKRTIEILMPEGADWIAMQKPTPDQITQAINAYYNRFRTGWSGLFAGYAFRTWTEKENQLHAYVIRKLAAMQRAILARDYHAFRTEVEENLTYRWPAPAFVDNSPSIGRSGAKDMLATLDRGDPADVDWDAVQQRIKAADRGNLIQSVLVNAYEAWWKNFPFRVVGFITVAVPIHEAGHNMKRFGFWKGLWKTLLRADRLFTGEAEAGKTVGVLLAGPEANFRAGFVLSLASLSTGLFTSHPQLAGYLAAAAVANLFWAMVEPALSFLIGRGDIFEASLQGAHHWLIRSGQALAIAA